MPLPTFHLYVQQYIYTLKQTPTMHNEDHNDNLSLNNHLLALAAHLTHTAQLLGNRHQTYFLIWHLTWLSYGYFSLSQTQEPQTQEHTSTLLYAP